MGSVAAGLLFFLALVTLFGSGVWLIIHLIKRKQSEKTANSHRQLYSGNVSFITHTRTGRGEKHRDRRENGHLQ
ncbi:hypothetical protein [Thalassobacillus sp. C254]|uniref:hypothetical protein n=1 Tax=Thalassobacillus sp. C254 TaxID=1225341 RepID=UPI0006D05B59|nr:hypothetical protein [Thalassobacillus sp. C254]